MLSAKFVRFKTAKNKGQMNFYFIISVVLFLTLAIYLVSVLISYNNTFRDRTMSGILYSKAVSVSDLLIQDSGYPDNWNSEEFMRVGLASSPYVLDLTKIRELEKICNSSDPAKFKELKDSFGLIDEDLSIKIVYLNNTNVSSCLADGEKVGRIMNIKRIAILNNNFVEVTVYVG
ncbi:MAG: hypothetical protein KAU95_01520 [Candidatus Aenigmarchaeota archaeon]|nr:hypothetical protein [Candidatus Aenigmarchaeota archaeon]